MTSTPQSLAPTALADAQTDSLAVATSQMNIGSTASSRPRTPAEGQGEWRLKEIAWPDPRVGGLRRPVRILMQDTNGPCSIIALANVLILRGSIHLPSKSSVTYDELASHIADFLLSRQVDDAATSALSILPTMTSHLHVDIYFDDIYHFKPTNDGGEIAVFKLCGVDLVHGWVVDPQTDGKDVVIKAGTYEGAQEGVVRGLESKEGQAVTEGNILRTFLDGSATQITYAGLFALSSKLEPGAVVALFRNSHLTVLYRRPGDDSDDPVLYQLVTDSSFLHEPEVTWESLVDLDGSAATFVNDRFEQGHPGDAHDADTQLARILQQEEDQEAAVQQDRADRRREEIRARRTTKKSEKVDGDKSAKEKKKKDCCIM